MTAIGWSSRFVREARKTAETFRPSPSPPTATSTVRTGRCRQRGRSLVATDALAPGDRAGPSVAHQGPAPPASALLPPDRGGSRREPRDGGAHRRPLRVVAPAADRSRPRHSL